MEKNYTKIIADYLRYSTNDNDYPNDLEMLEVYGGDTYNGIIVDFEDGTYLYKSIDTSITVFNYIDTNNLANSKANEPLN